MTRRAVSVPVKSAEGQTAKNGPAEHADARAGLASRYADGAAILIRDLEPFRQARPVWDRAAEMILLAAARPGGQGWYKRTDGRLIGHERYLTQGTGRAGAGVRVAIWVDPLIRQNKECQLASTATWCRKPVGGRILSYLRRTSLVSSHELGARAKHWPLHRSLECRSWTHTVSRRILVSRAYKATRLTIAPATA